MILVLNNLLPHSYQDLLIGISTQDLFSLWYNKLPISISGYKRLIPFLSSLIVINPSLSLSSSEKISFASVKQSGIWTEK